MNKMYKYLCVFIIIIAIFCQLEWTSTEAHYIQWEYHEIPRPSKKLIPSDIMVDITNDLSYRILHYHSISNRNNIAFSPTALTSVLIALYEGSSGRSTLELKHVLGLPENRDITRIGYRDVHRRLRTYFFVQDNPLIGLSLNKENVTITPEYEAILKFYGYDLGMDMISSTPSTPEVVALSENPKTTVIPDCITEMKQEDTTTTTIPISEDKINELDVIETTTEKHITTELPSVTTMPTTITTEVPTMIPLTTIPTTTSIPLTTTIEPFTTESTTEAIQRTTMYIRTFKPVLTQTVSQLDRLRENPSAITVDNTLLPGRRTNRNQMSFISGTPVTSASTVRESGNNRAKRHFFHGLDYNNGYQPGIPNQNTEIDTNVYVTFVPASQINEPLPPPSRTYVPHEFNVYDQLLGLAGMPLDQTYITPKEISRNNIINHIFYLNPHETIQTTYKIYNSILNYNYLESLKISILELELDAEEYNLLILLPDFNVDMDTAIASLKLAPTLRLLRKQLKPRWVQAIIPDFHIKGNIYLTNDLQNMGIDDIFEPTRADFTPMSNESNIYVKHIEQSINVHIHTRSIDQIKRNIAQQYRPIEVAVNHPFIFFIVDKELDVALMAGKILNPLNIRIQ